MERGYGAPSQTYPLGALRLPRIARNRGSLHLPYLEIKLTFECTARFYGLAQPLQSGIHCHWMFGAFSACPVKYKPTLNGVALSSVYTIKRVRDSGKSGEIKTYTLWVIKKLCTLFIGDNFGECRLILIIFSLLHFKVHSGRC